MQCIVSALYLFDQLGVVDAVLVRGATNSFTLLVAVEDHIACMICIRY